MYLLFFIFDIIPIQTIKTCLPMKKIHLIAVLTLFSYFASGQIIINEVLYDPSNNALDGDANGDGVYDQEEDSFIEFYNTSDSDFDMSGWQIWDDTTKGELKYEIPDETLIPAKRALVVFGGGTPTGSFGGAIVLVASESPNGLSLNNSGEVIVIKDNNGVTKLIFDSDALSNNPNESYTRNPDITGDFEQHNDNTPLLFSPGTKIDGTPFGEEGGTSISNLENVNLDVKIYPNPATESIKIISDEQVNSFEIYHYNGQLIQVINSTVKELPIEFLSNGMYFLRVYSDEKSVAIPFVKQ